MVKNKSLLPILCAALGNIIWGFSFLFTKLGVDASPNPNVMLSHRFIIATLFMLVLMLMGKGKLSFKGKKWLPMLSMLVMQVAYYLFETYGIIHTNTTISGLVLAVVPVVTIGTGALFLREYPTLRQALFCVMPVAGVILMTVSGNDLGVITPVGVVFLALTLITSAAYKTVNRKAAEEFTTFERSFLVMANAAIVFSVVGMNAVGWNVKAYVAPLWDMKYLLSVLSLGLLCSVAAQLLTNYASGKMSVFKMSSFGALSTLCSAFAGVVILKEPINWVLLLGAALILVGIRQVTKPK